MNSEKLKEFMQGIGMMTEVWTISYRGFKTQGLNDEDALKNTRYFMSSLLDSMMRCDNSDQEEKQ